MIESRADVGRVGLDLDGGNGEAGTGGIPGSQALGDGGSQLVKALVEVLKVRVKSEDISFSS